MLLLCCLSLLSFPFPPCSNAYPYKTLIHLKPHLWNRTCQYTYLILNLPSPLHSSSSLSLSLPLYFYISFYPFFSSKNTSSTLPPGAFKTHAERTFKSPPHCLTYEQPMTFDLSQHATRTIKRFITTIEEQ